MYKLCSRRVLIQDRVQRGALFYIVKNFNFIYHSKNFIKTKTNELMIFMNTSF